jgi:hypothetical protein
VEVGEWTLEKETGSECPGCGLLSLDVYYEDDCDSPIGAKCENCGFRGFFMKEELVPLAAV